MLDEDGNPVKGILRLRPAEAEALAKAHRDVLDGATVAGIARDWNERGILTSKGKRWRGAEVGRVLRRARNAGLMEYQGQVGGTCTVAGGRGRGDLAGGGGVLDDPERKTTPGPARKHLLSFIATLRRVRRPGDRLVHQRGG